MMRALIAAMFFGVVFLTAPSLWALQEEETKTESQPESDKATDAKADDKKADDKDAKAKDAKKKADGEEEAEADKKKKDEVKENADAAMAELEKAEAAPAVEVAPAAPAPEAAPAVEVAPVVEAAPAPKSTPVLRGTKDSKASGVFGPGGLGTGIKNAVKEKSEEKEKPAWAGSSVVFGTNTDLGTFIKSVNGEYNPTVKNSIKLRPSWVLNKQYSLSGNIGFTCELFTTPGSASGGTNVTTCSASNLSIGLSLGELYNIYDVSIRGRASLSLPTNTLTREMGGLYGINAGVSATRSFKELGGLSLTYSFGMSHDGTKTLYGLDIADERSGDRIVAPRVSEAPLPDTVPVESNYGAAAALGFSNGLSASYTATDWLSLSGSFSFENTLLDAPVGEEYDGELERGVNENTAQLTGNDTVWRAFLSYSLVASIKIPQVPYLGISTGLAWYQKAPHYTGSYIAPFRPKDTSIFLNFSINAAKLMDELL